jgi:hypothetical protein
MKLLSWSQNALPYSRDGMPPPAGLPDGECICTRLDDGSIRIDQADPRILISGEVLDAIIRRPSSVLLPGYALALRSRTRLDTAGCMPPPWRATYVGAVLHIDGVNRQVVYRVTDYVARINGYIGEWPD